MSCRLKMNAEEAKSTSCSLEINAQNAAVGSLPPSFPNGTLASAFSSSPPAAPTGCPSGSPLQEHHVTTLTPASPRPVQKQGREPCGVLPRERGEGGGEVGSPNWVARTSRRPKGRVQGVCGKMRNRFLSINFNSVEIHPITAYFRITAVMSPHRFTHCCFLYIYTQAPDLLFLSTKSLLHENRVTSDMSI